MKIGSQLKFNNVTVSNRVLIQPMEGCDGNNDGGIGALTRRRYLRFAESGAGIIWFEATAVCDAARANPRQLRLKEDNVAGYKELLDEMRRIGIEKHGFAPIVILQATHSGRYSKPYGAPRPIVAYRNPLYEQGKEALDYHVLSDEECDAIADLYAETARLASLAGFDGVDVKCCHGYLFDEFLGAFDREGRYGGSLENRTRLYFSCVDAVRENISPNMFVTTRLSAYDGFPYPYGFGADADGEIDLQESKAILSRLAGKGIELVNITIGNPYLIPSVSRPYIGAAEDGMIGVQRVVGVTRELQKAFPQLKLVLSALSYLGERAIDFAEECLQNGTCSLVGFGRMSFAYPQFYQDYLTSGRLDKNKVCVKCGNCSKMMRAGGVAGCPVRDREIYLPLYRKYVEGKNE